MAIRTHDVLIVGGGPGGLYLAQTLARDGFDVIAFEEHEVTGQPVHCTGIVATEAFREFAIPKDVVLNEVKTARFFSPSGQSIAYSTPTLEAVVIDRTLFDQRLGLHAEKAGATVLRGSKVTKIEIGDDRVDVQTGSGQTFYGRCCVLACGANYLFHRKFGLGLPSFFLQSAQMEVPASCVGDVELHFGRQIAPKGFCWIVPVIRGAAHYARVGLMCERAAPFYFQRFLESVEQRWQLEAHSAFAPRRKILPLGHIGKTYANRLIAIGDAAGLVKGTTGGGIYYSIASGAIAAAVLSEALRRDRLDEAGLSRYEKEWRHRLGAEIDAQLSFRRLVQELADSQIESLFDLARTNGLMPLVRQTARFNHHRDLIVELLRHKQAREILLRRVMG